MAEAPAAEHHAGGGPLGVITQKVGPLPVWAYAALIVAAYYLYTKYKGSSSSTSTTSTTGSTDQTYVPPFDAAGYGGSGGIGNTAIPDTVNNYYYGDGSTAQASGGGTSSGTGSGTPSSSPTPTPGGGLSSYTVPEAYDPATAGVPGGQGAVKVPGGRLTQ